MMAGRLLSGSAANRVATTATSSASRCSSGLARATWAGASAPGGGTVCGSGGAGPVSYTHLRAHETSAHL
eukprot:810886-Alexandrium_andersonii.AAC.1